MVFEAGVQVAGALALEPLPQHQAGERRIGEDEARAVNHVLEQVLVRGSGYELGIDLPDASAAKTGTTPRWNFYKYLIARDGVTVTSFNSMADPASRSFVADVEKQLAAR